MPFATRAGVVLLVSALVACSGRSGTHIEPQVAPYVATGLVHSPTDPALVLVREYSGLLSLWRFAELHAPDRVATVFTDAHLATFSADGKTIVVVGKDGRLRILDFGGRAIAESRDTAGKLPRSLAVDTVERRVVTAGEDGLWSWSLPDLSRASIEANVQASAVAFSGDGALAVGYSSGAIRVISKKPASDVRLGGHEGEILSLAFLPSSDKLLAGSSRSVRLWDVKKPGEATVLKTAAGGDQSFNQVMVDPSGGHFAASYDDDEDDDEESALWLWNAKGVHLTTYTTDSEVQIRSAGLFPGGHAVAITTAGLQTFRLSFAQHRAELPDRCTAAYSPERDHLGVACEDGAWIVPGHGLTREAFEQLRAGARPQLAVIGKPLVARFLTGGARLAVVTHDGSVLIWQLDQPATRSVIPAGSENDPVDIAESGSLLAIAQKSGRVSVWNADGSERGQIAAGQDLKRIAVSESAGLVASGGDDGRLALWNLSGELKRRVDTSVTGLAEILALQFSPDARAIFAVDANGNGVDVTIEGEVRNRFKGIKGAYSIAVSKADGRLAFGKGDGDIALHSTDGQLTQLDWAVPDETVTSLSFTPPGTGLVAIIIDDELATSIGLWQPTLAPLETGLKSKLNIPRPALSNTGSVLFTGGTSWNLVTSQVTAGAGDSVVLSPGGRVVAVLRSSGGESSVRIRDAEGTAIRELSVPFGWDMAVSDTGRLAYVEGYEKLHLEHPEGRFEPKPEAGKVGSVLASPDGRWIGVRNDGTVSVWGADGAPAPHPLSAAPPLPTKFARGAAVSPDGSRIAMFDSATGIWIRGPNGTSGPIVLPPVSRAGDVQQVAFWRDGNALAAISGNDLFYWDVDDPAKVKRWRGGVSISNVRATDDGLWAAASRGELYLLDRRLEMLARVVASDDGAVAITRDGRYAGYGPLYQRTRLYTEDLTRLAESEAVKHFSLERVRLTMMRQLGWWTLTRETVIATYMVAVAKYGELPGWAKAGFWPTAIYMVLLLTMVGMWIVVPAKVAALAMPSYTEAELPAWKVVTDTLSLARWLGNTGRALDGWLIKTRPQQLAQGFEGKGAIQKRSVYVDLGNEEDVAVWTAAVTTKAPAHFWVSGPGGCGKSTLAFHLVRVALEHSGKRPVIPVVIDSDWTGPLLEHVAETLRQGSRRPTLAMVRRLAYTGRLVLVVDGLSERRSDDARTEVLALTDTRVLRYLIVTARSEKPPRDEIRQVTVGPLEGARLATFVAAYVDESRRTSALASVRALSKGQPIRPLFATIALEWFARDESIPDNYPALIHTYVQRLCPQGDAALREDDFLRASRLVAFATVKDGWTPRAVSREFVRGQLDAEALPFLSAAERPVELSPSVVIDQLVQCGLVEQLAALGAHEVRFSFDPVAEYLAAMHIVMLERGAASPRLPDPLPDTPFAEALRSIKAAVV